MCLIQLTPPQQTIWDSRSKKGRKAIMKYFEGSIQCCAVCGTPTTAGILLTGYSIGWPVAGGKVKDVRLTRYVFAGYCAQCQAAERIDELAEAAEGAGLSDLIEIYPNG